MAGIQTSNITTNNGDLTITPNNGQTLIKSVQTNNPGVTPVAASSDGTVKKFIITDLDTKNTLDDNDWVVVHDSGTGNTVRVPGSEFGGAVSQPLFEDPLPETGSPWVDKDGVLAVKEGGLGSTTALKKAIEFAVNSDTYNQADKNVTSGSEVKVRWVDSLLDSATEGQTVSGTLYTKSGPNPPFEQTWNLVIIKQPQANWDIPPRTNQDVNAEITSDLSLPTGMTWRSPVTIDGGTLTNIKVSVNGGAFTTNPGYIESGQPIQIQGTTGGSFSTAYTAQVSIGGLQRTWNVTTMAQQIACTVETGDLLTPDTSGSYYRDDLHTFYVKVNPTQGCFGAPVDLITSKSYQNGTEVWSYSSAYSVDRFEAFPAHINLVDGDTLKVEWQHGVQGVSGDQKTHEFTAVVVISRSDNECGDVQVAMAASGGSIPAPGSYWAGGLYVGATMGKHWILGSTTNYISTRERGVGSDGGNMDGHTATLRCANNVRTGWHKIRDSAENGYTDWFGGTNTEMSAVTSLTWGGTSERCKHQWGIGFRTPTDTCPGKPECGSAGEWGKPESAHGPCWNGGTDGDTSSHLSVWMMSSKNDYKCDCKKFMVRGGGYGNSGAGGSFIGWAWRCLD